MADKYKVTKDGITLPNVDREMYPTPSAAFGAVVETDDDGRVLSVELPEDRFFPFAKPGGRVKHDVLYTVKAMKPSGVVVQLPLEDQINNHVASPENMVGIMPYVRKDFIMFWDMAKMKGDFCPTKDCFAKWNDEFAGFCDPSHKQITAPRGESLGFGEGATTSKSYRGV